MPLKCFQTEGDENAGWPIRSLPASNSEGGTLNEKRFENRTFHDIWNRGKAYGKKKS